VQREDARGSGKGGGRKRKWYRLSAKGRRRLEQRVAAHRAYQKVIESFLPPLRRRGAK
jgi:DNA-binding PadR family transcriptional regulator